MTDLTCPACGAPSFAGTAASGTCSTCGYAAGESERCPHCRAISRIDGKGRTSICAVCGGPRIPGGRGGEASKSALRAQSTALAEARAASIATVVQGLLVIVTVLLGLAIAPASLVGKLVEVAIALAFSASAVRSASRASSARRRAAGAADKAWESAAEEVARTMSDGVTANGLGTALGLDVANAERLLTALSVGERTRIDVGEDAELHYRVDAPENATDAGSPAETPSDGAQGETDDSVTSTKGVVR